MWWKYTRTVTGTVRVQGDANASPTYPWWRPLRLARQIYVEWQLVAVFEISEEDAQAGYQIGYVDFSGNARLRGGVLHHRVIRLRIGREDVDFFARRAQKTYRCVPLGLIEITRKGNSIYSDTPLI